MTVVFLVYGLAFIVLGVAILASPRVGLDKPWTTALHWMGYFGLLHGVNEWVDMFALIAPDRYTWP